MKKKNLLGVTTVVFVSVLLLAVYGNAQTFRNRGLSADENLGFFKIII